MTQLLINLVFGILNFIANVFLSPIFSGISTLIPELGTLFSGITTFLGYGIQYTEFFIKLLMIPTWLTDIVLAFWSAIFIFNTTIRVVGLGMAIYHWFKP